MMVVKKKRMLIDSCRKENNKILCSQATFWLFFHIFAVLCMRRYVIRYIWLEYALCCIFWWMHCAYVAYI